MSRNYLNEKEFTEDFRKKLERTYKSFLRLKLGAISSGVWVSRYRKKVFTEKFKFIFNVINQC